MKNKFLTLSLIAICCVPVEMVLARSDDRDKPIHITADTAELNDKTGISIYRGDVKMVQGTTILTGDVVTIYSTDSEVERIISIGELATYQETTDDGDDVYAEAEEMIYNRLLSTIDLYRDAKVTQEENVFKSEHILYKIEEELIEAGNNLPDQQKERVNMTIMPESKIIKGDDKMKDDCKDEDINKDECKPKDKKDDAEN